MCIVIDTNTFASVFDPSSEKHSEFKPVLEWIVFGNGKIVYGGSKYKQELREARKYLSFFLELSKARKTKEINDAEVDEKQKEIERIVNDKKFNDPQIVAIIVVSGCKLICSEDKSAYPFFKRKDLYPKHITRPKIYSKASNADLLSDNNIAEICKPTRRLPKELGQGVIQNL